MWRLTGPNVTAMTGLNRTEVQVTEVPVTEVPRTLRIAPISVEMYVAKLDTYLPALKAAITEGKADSIMCVYNSINAAPGRPTPKLQRGRNSVALPEFP